MDHKRSGLPPSDMFVRIIGALHEATLDESRWRETSALIDEACGNEGSHLVIVGGRLRPDAKWLFDQCYYRGELHLEGRDYAENYYPHDERIPRLLALPDARVTPMTDLYTAAELKTSATFNEMLRFNDAENGLNIRMDGPAGLQIVWVLANSIAADGWSTAQIEMIERLLPHIRQFVRVRQALVASAALGTSLADLVDNMTLGLICLDWRGRIVQMNSGALALIRRGDGLEERSGYLHARLAADDMQLQKLLNDALPRSGRQGKSSSMAVARPLAHLRLALHITPVLGDAGFGFGQVATLVLVVDPLAQPRIDPALVEKALGLTPSESRVAVALAEGATMRDIATATRRAESTVRELVKRIHTKLGISRRADLVRIVLRLAGGESR